MKPQKWCNYCKKYFDRATFDAHRKLHERERNIDAKSHIQYTGLQKKGKTEIDDYMICVLHQKKVPCSVKGCNYMPFGKIRKSYMMKCARGIYLEWMEGKDTIRKKTFPFFPDDNEMIPIDMKTRTVIIKGASIRLKI